MRLVDRNVLTLEDPASRYIDRALKEFGTTMVDTLGTRAADVTVGQLIQMRSGVSDFDVPDFDNFVLKNSNRTYSPLDFLTYVSGLKDEICEADYAGNCKCTFFFRIKKISNLHDLNNNNRSFSVRTRYVLLFDITVSQNQQLEHTTNNRYTSRVQQHEFRSRWSRIGRCAAKRDILEGLRHGSSGFRFGREK